MSEFKATDLAESRPYRSHRIRACDYCRRRKQRCIVGIIGQPCGLCKHQGIACYYASSDTPSSERRESRRITTRSTRRASNVSLPGQTERLQNQQIALPITHLHTSPEPNQSIGYNASDNLLNFSHIVGPVASKDAYTLDRYMSPWHREGRRTTGNPYNVYSANPDLPVLYTTVEGRRLPGISMNKTAGIEPKNIMDQVLAANASILLKFYLSKIHPCFPVVDERRLSGVVGSGNDRGCPAALICEVYAVTLTYWSQINVVVGGCPHQHFAWDLAVKALQEDFLAPDISTLQAVLIDLSGRPVFSITRNGTSKGQAAALANSLGINRNPKEWNISQQDKNLRVRIWWGVLVHDTWGSLAHGTPPNVNPDYHDVPIPTPKDLSSSSASSEYLKSSECFIALCQLTEILQQILPLVYNLRVKPVREIRKVLRSVETELDQWEDDLPDQLQKSPEMDANVSGSCSLQLCLLSLKMLACRVSLHAMDQLNEEERTPEALSYLQSQCRISALAIVNFISSLKSFHYLEFWLPHGAYIITSATTLLLRIAIETTDDTIATYCVSSVKQFGRHLQNVREVYGWDLGDHCLTHCQGIIERIAHNRIPTRQADEEIGLPEEMTLDLSDPFDWLGSSLPVSFGEMGGVGQGRDIWGLLDFDASNDEFYM